MSNKQTFKIGEWVYVDAGGNQLWRERLLWELDGKALKNPLKDRQALSLSDFIKARNSLLAKQ